MGSLRMGLFYLIIMFGSNLFGATVSSNYAMGSEPIIYGFLAALLSIVIVYWDRISGTTCTKACTLMMATFVFIIVTLLVSQTASTA